MGWPSRVVTLLVLRYVALVASMPHSFTLPQTIDEDDIHQMINGPGERDNVTPMEYYEDMKLEHLGRMLANILVQPWPRGISPILYVEEFPSNDINEGPGSQEDMPEEQAMMNTPYKRSRYYRKYPWKRQNSRYDAENRYLCQPSKEDVFRLLVALHEARQGNRGQNVNFCNRKRPATTIFTNIRFLG